MSIDYATGLLQRYNPKKVYTSSEKVGFGQRSYANVTDMLYEKYSTDMNFNMNAWRDAVKVGKQDVYLSFLEQNQGIQMSDAFYDQNQYNFEYQMLELYKNLADNSAKSRKLRQREVYDPNIDDFTVKDIGEMTEREYIQYQLDEAKGARDFALDRALDVARKKTMGFWERNWNVVKFISAEFGEGLLGGLVGFIDAINGLGVAATEAAKGTNYLDAYVDFIANKGLLAKEQEFVREALSEWERKNVPVMSVDGEFNTFGRWTAGIANSMGRLLPSMIAAKLTAGLGSAAQSIAGTGSFYTSIFASNVYERANDPLTQEYPSYIILANAAATAAAEALVEVALDFMLGGTVMNQALGLTGRGIIKPLRNLNGIGYLAKGALQEGLEEVLQDLATEAVDQLFGLAYEGYKESDLTWQTLSDSFIVGVLSSLLMTSSKAYISNPISNKIAKKTDGKYGNFNPVVESKGTLKELKGLKALAWSERYAGIIEDIKSLEDQEEVNLEKDMRTILNVYRNTTVLSEFYASIGPERMKAVEALMNKTIESKKKVDTETQRLREAYKALKADDANRLERRVAKEMSKTKRAEVEADFKAARDTFAKKTMKIIQEMVGGAPLRFMKDLVKNDEFISKLIEYDMLDIERLITKEDRPLDDTITSIQNDILQDKYNSLLKDYNYIFVTNGKSAVEVDDALFISKSWLINYKTSDTYKFLCRENVFSAILKDKTWAPMIEAALAHNKEFTGRTAVSKERAIMDLLFNHTVFQHFLLSQEGKNVHQFKNTIFRLYALITVMGNDSKISAEKKAQFKEILKEIQNTQRIPILKAIVNWNMDPTEVGADVILTEKDKQFLNMHMARKNLFSSATTGVDITEKESKLGDTVSEKANKNLSALQNVVGINDLLPGSIKHRIAEKMIERGLRKDATNLERIEAVLLLQIGRDYSASLPTYITEDAKLLDIINRILDGHSATREDIDALIAKRNSKYYFVGDKDLERFKNLSEFNPEKSSPERLRQFAEDLKYFLLSVYAQNRNTTSMFTIPPEAMEGGSQGAAWDQYKADILYNFEKEYGISASLMYRGAEIKPEYLSKYLEDKNRLKAKSVQDFVKKRLEEALGDRYIVTQKYVYAGRGVIPAFFDMVIDLQDTINVVKRNATLTQLDDIRRKIFILFSALSDLKFESELYDTLRDMKESQQLDWIRNNLSKIESELSVIRQKNRIDGFQIVEKVPTSTLIKGVFLEDNNILLRHMSFINMFRKNEKVPLVNFLRDDLSPVVFEKLKKYHVTAYPDPGETSDGWFDVEEKEIYINTARVRDYFSVLTHEINHALQYDFHITRGFNEDDVTPELATYVRSSFSTVLQITGVTPEYLAYRLVLGELLANTRFGEPIAPALTMTRDWSGAVYLVSSEGRKIKMPYTDNISEQRLSQEMASNMMTSQFEETLMTRAEGFDSDFLHDRFNTRLTKTSSVELLNSIINKNLPPLTQITVKLDEAIKNPEIYLADEVLDFIQREKGSLDEGSVYYGLKELFEGTTDGVSIDRDGMTHQYIFVDNHAFDDLMRPEIKKYVGIDEKGSLSKLLGGINQTLSLDTFYKRSELEVLGISATVKVVTGENVKTEATQGTEGINISIKTNKDMSTGEFLNKLNHEFRHVMQLHNRLETGFTADFKMTKELLADIKKRVPEIFNERNREWAKATGRTDTDVFIAQRFVYYMIGGELEAFGFKASMLNTKPAYVTTEAGNPTIFMPWYNAETGEGRYKTEFLASREDDADTSIRKRHQTKRETLRVDKKGPSYIAKIDTGKTNPKTGAPIYKYIYDQKDRYVSKTDASKSNLKFFSKTGEDIQLSPKLQNFVIATTNKLDVLPKELRYAIETGKLTEQTFVKWFNEVDPGDVSDEAFKIIAEHYFENTTFKSMQEVQTFVDAKLDVLWATINVLTSEGITNEALLKKLTLEKVLAFSNEIKDEGLGKKIGAITSEFSTVKAAYNEDGKLKWRNIEIPDSERRNLRRLAMQWYDGTLAGAYYVANTLRYNTKHFTHLRESSEQYIENYKTHNQENTSNYIANAAGDSLVELYNVNHTENVDDILSHLAILSAKYFTKKAKEAKLSEADTKKYVAIKANEYLQKLKQLSDIDIRENYKHYEEHILRRLGTIDTVLPSTRKTDLRVNIVQRIKTSATKIINAVTKGDISFNNLPKEVQAMFELKTVTKDGKKYQRYELKSEIYSVGRGRKAGTKTELNLQVNYKHDTKKIIKNAEVLAETMKNIKAYRAEQRIEQRTATELGVKLDEKTREEIREVKEERRRLTKENSNLKETIFKLKKKLKDKTSDTPNVFSIVSKTDMPDIVRVLFDTSFTAMADTKVQFASVDKDGNLLTKQTEAEFEGALQHEISNWDNFYEANRQTLLNLTREQVVEIVKFFGQGLATLDGPANKLHAFQIFTLGYILAGARVNANNWNLSDSEVEVIRKLYEKKGSEYGSGLNAVGQMLKVIDPLKKVRQEMLSMYGINDTELDPLFNAIDSLQTETDITRRKEKAVDVLALLEDIEERMKKNDPRQRGFGKNAWNKFKSARYTFMLSSPTTWIRNIVSNVVVYNFNKTSDFIGRLIFVKKGYKEGQVDLASVKPSKETTAFVKENFTNNKLFESVFEGTTKYDERARKETVASQREYFINLLVGAARRKYAAQNRFDSPTANRIAKFVSHMISDKKFIKSATENYFSRMLEIAVKEGKVTLNEGLSYNVLNLFTDAVIIANEDYMHKRSFLADAIDSLREKSPFWYEVMHMWQPFLNSSFNWFSETVKYTPVGLVSSIVKMATLEKRIAKIEERRLKGEVIADSKYVEYLTRRDVGKGVLGTMLLGLGVILGLTGMLRIEEEDDRFFIYAGDVKLDISNIFGSSSVLIGASLTQIGNAKFDDIMRLASEAMFESFMLKEMLDRHRWDNTFWEAILTEGESILRSFTPQMVQLMIRAMNNEKIKYSDGMKGMWERWLNSFVPTQPFGERKINPYTGEVETKYALPVLGEFMKSGILGPRVIWSEASETEVFAKGYGINKTSLTGEITIDGAKIKMSHVHELNVYYGQLNKKSLAELEKTKHNVETEDGKRKILSWSQMNDDQRARVIKRTMTTNAEIAKIYIWTQKMGNKYEAGDTLYKELKKKGVSQNVLRGGKGFVEQK